MPQNQRRFERITLDQFIDLLSQFPFRRRINAVHMHHTWRPNHAQYRRDPEGAVVAMWRFHTQERKFSDIAQHITIGPDGEIWLGRNWDLPPASATGHNGNSVAGPFMFEMVGDFDLGGDPFTDPQRSVALQVVAQVQQRFKLPAEALRFHNQMSSKSCPGTQVAYDAIVEEVRQIRAALDQGGRSMRALGAFGEEASPARETTRRIVELYGDAIPAAPRALVDEGELDEETMTLAQERALAGAASTRAVRAGQEAPLTPEELERLRPHVVNLRLGAFSSQGRLSTRQQDVDRIFEEELPAALAKAAAEGRKLPLLFYAHGGLVGESAGISLALDQIEFWKRNGAYPIFFIWETGLLETASDILRRTLAPTRGILEDISDTFLEAIGRPAGRIVWGQMKRSAEISVLSGGGALYVAQKTAQFVAAHAQAVEVHTVGHSAGSIFHSHFIPALIASGLGAVRSLHLLAPAETIPLFREKLLPLAAGWQLERVTMYTMKRSYELDDTAGPYKKSLLYLVHHSFEDPDETPILGLEENLRADRDLARFFGLAGGGAANGEVIFSVTPSGAPPRSASRSTSHGGFDNDAATMNSIVRRVLDVADSVPIFEYPDRARQLAEKELERIQSLAGLAAAVGTPPAIAPPAVTPPPPAPPPEVAVTGGKKKALCVGINAYPSPYELDGCVADANNWAAALQSLGFETRIVLDQDANRATILSELTKLIGGASAGDIVVFQYAGHGTSLKDIDGDEEDATDEALVPADFIGGAFVIDDDLRAIFQSTPPGVSVTCFIDCCHSGTITRLLSGLAEENARTGASKRRFIRSTAEMQAAHRSFRTSIGGTRAAPKLHGPDEMTEVLFSACLPSEVAYETNGNGDFTSRAIPILKSGKPLTNAEFQQAVTTAFGTPARQHPNMDCAPESANRRLLAPLAAAQAAVAAKV